MDETHADPQPPRKVGRAVFLGAVVGGVSSLYWGKAVWGKISARLSPARGAHPADPVGRLADLHRLRPHAVLRPADLAPRPRRPRRASRRRSPTTQLRALPKVEQISTFHCVTGWTVKNVRWGGVRLNDVLALASPKPTAHALEFVSAEMPVRRLADDPAGRPARRDARLRDGREAAPARARRAGAARDPRDVRLQERQVAEGHQPRPERRRPATGRSSATTVDAWVGRSNGYGS